MTDEIMIDRLCDAHDEEMQRIFYNDESCGSSHWDEWCIDNAIDRDLEERYDHEH